MLCKRSQAGHIFAKLALVVAHKYAGRVMRVTLGSRSSSTSSCPVNAKFSHAAVSRSRDSSPLELEHLLQNLVLLLSGSLKGRREGQ
jgi:hypothetical protein